MTTSVNTERWAWADIARGIAILLVLIGHSCPPPYTTAFIYAFHMPLFFILSGLFMKQDTPLRPLLNKRVRTLLVPFVCYNLLILFSDWCIVALSPNYHAPIDIPARLMGIVTGSRSGSWAASLWFLPALFVAQWLVIGCHRLAAGRRNLCIAMWVLLSVVGFTYCHEVGTALPLSIDVAFVATGFLLIGSQWVRRGFEGQARWYWFVTAILFVTMALDNFHTLGGGDNHVDMSTDTLGHPLEFYTAAVAGSLLLIRACQQPAMQRSNILQWMGRNSLAIYCIHRIPMNLGVALVNLVPRLNSPDTAAQTVRSLLLVLFTLAILVPAVFIVNRWFPWTLGKKRDCAAVES